MHPPIAGRNDASALFGASAFPGGDGAAGTRNDRDQSRNVVRLDPGLADELGMTGRNQAVGVASSAVTRQPDAFLNLAEGGAVGLVHEARARREQHRVGELGAGPRQENALSGRPAVTRAHAVAAEPLANKRLV